MRTRFASSAAVGLVLLGAACGDSTAPAVARRVILVTCDTLRADHLGCYGYPRPTSPAVDAFARDATTYENAWSCCSITGPALSTILSGRLPDELGLGLGNRMYMSAAVETLPEILGAAGISTSAVVSNWVLRRPAPELGDVGVAQGFASFDDKMDVAELNRDSRERRAEATTDAALAWLDGPGRADRFFLWVHYQDPHGPYDPPEELARPFLADLPADEAPLPVSTSNRGKDGIPAYQRIGDERRPGRYRARYDGEIAAFDRGFGRLLAGLGERGLLEDALVIFTADHGESLGEHERWFCHAENLHVEETRVPLVVRFPASTPGGARRGERRAELASHLDLFPTVLAAFGLAPPPRIGASLLAVSLPADRVVPQTLYPLESPRRWEALTSQRHRLVFNRRYGMRLYDLATDPGELHDLAAEDPATLARIQAQGRALLRANPAGPAPAVQPSDEESARALRAMGYAGEEDEERDPGGAEKGRR